MRTLLTSVLIMVLQILLIGHSQSQEWSQWNGPSRDGRLDKTDVRIDFSNASKPVWRVECGLGFSGPIVTGDRVFIADYLLDSGDITNNAGKRDELKGRERIRCLNRSSGQVEWQHDYDRSYRISYPSGPRATPTAHDGLLYCLGSEGDLLCLNASNGNVVWKSNFTEDFGAKTPLWGHAASPLVYQSTLICMVGGEGSLVVAFDLKTGVIRWKCLSSFENETGYCPPTIVNAGGVDQLIVWDPKTLYSLNPNTGAEYWNAPVAPGYGMSILPAVTDGDLLFVSGESRTSAMFRLNPSQPAADLLWRGGPKNSFYLATSNAIFDDGHIYGADISSGALICFEAVSGERKWMTAVPTTGSDRGRGAAHGSAFLVRCNNGYLILSETGALIHAKLSPEGYNEISRFQAIDPTTNTMGRTVLWTYPAVAFGHVYLRNDKEVVCYQISAELN